jgi:hypothetical protein
MLSGLDPFGGRLDPGAVVAVEPGQERQHQRPDGGQDQVGEEQRGGGQHDQQDHGHGERDRVEDLGGRLDVGLGVGEQLPGRLGLVVGQRQHPVAVDHPGPQGLRDPGRGEPGEEAARHDPEGVDDGDPDDGQGTERDRGGADPAAVEGGQQDLVGDPAQHDRAGHRGERVEAGPGHREPERPRVHADVGTEDAKSPERDTPVV